MTAANRLERFVALSAELTAFTSLELYGTSMAKAYLDAIETVVGVDLVDALLDGYAGIGAAGKARTAALRRIVFGDERFGPIARNIVKLWYIGTWFALPASWQERFGPAPADRTFVVSPTAYIQGLLWVAIGAHPPGAKAPGFGSWAAPPKIPKF